MDVEKYKAGVKKRREERLRLIRNKQRKSALSSSSFSPPSLSTSKEKQDHYSSQSSSVSLMIKVACSCLLVAGVYMVMEADHPQFSDTQRFIQEVMHQEFNVEGVMTWYESTVGERPGFLPTFIRREEVSAPPNSEKPSIDYGVPVTSGTIVSRFEQDRPGIVVETLSEQPVEVVKEGWVTFVGEKEGLEQTVIIDHGNDEESWYGKLGDVQVGLHEWVDQGDVLASTGEDTEEGQGIFYFALRKDAVFIDPLDVISFE